MGKFKKGIIKALACFSIATMIAGFAACEIPIPGVEGLINKVDNALGTNSTSEESSVEEVEKQLVVQEDSIFCFDVNGVMQTNCEFGGYKFGEDGRIESENVFVEVNDAVYYVQNRQYAKDYKVVEDYMYNFGEDGKMKKNCDHDGKHFDEEGKMDHKGFIDIKEDTYYFGDEKKVAKEYEVVEEYVYHFGDDGKMKKDCKHDGKYFDGHGKLKDEGFVDVDEDTYYVEPDQKVAKDYKVFDEFLYFFGDNGAMKKDCDFGDGFHANKDGHVSADEQKELTVGGTRYWLNGFLLSLAYSLGLEYEISFNETCYVKGMGECTDVDLIIPDEWDSKTVIGILENAFKDNELIISVKLPDTITEIGDKAFSGCTALVKITMPDQIDMGKDVFRGSINVEITIHHLLEYVEAKESTCEQAGNIAYYYCTHCDKLYKDPNGEEQIYDVVIPAAHDFVDGECTKCGKVQDDILIVWVDSIPYLGKFPLGTLETAIGLPKTVNVKTADGLTHTLNVQWELTDYDKSQVGEYIIRGHLQAGDFHFGPDVSAAVEARIDIVEEMKGTADIVFIIDTSGSMSGELANVKNNIIKLAQAIEDYGVSARWGVVDYSDWEDVSGEDTRIWMNGTSPWFIDANEYKGAISSINLRNGGDAPEVAVDGLMAALSMGGRQDARTFYVLVTDCNYKNDNHYGVANMGEAIDKLQEEDVHVSVVTNSSYSSVYSTLVSETGGILLTNVSGSFMDTLYTDLVEKIYADVIA